MAGKCGGNAHATSAAPFRQSLKTPGIPGHNEAQNGWFAMLTWDVTYRGMPIGDAAWRAPCKIRSEDLQVRTPSGSDDSAHYEATAALHADGRILYCQTCTLSAATASPTTQFHWCQYRLTEYGRFYALHRLK
jgi:hypothetical protein